MANTWFKKTDKRKITFKSGNNESKIDFILVTKENRKFLTDVKVIPWELQHRLLVAEVDKRKLNKVVKKESRVKRMVWKLKEREMQEKFERRVKELVDVKTTNLWESFRDGVLTACDELCGKKVRKNGGSKWWWNEEVRNAIGKKKEAFKPFCKTGLEEHKIFYRKMRNQTKKVIAKAMKTEAEKEMEELREKPNKIFKFVKFMKRDGKDVEGGKWIKGRDGRIGFSQKDRCKIWKEHMEKIMNEENAWDHKMDAAMVEGQVEQVSCKEVREAIRKIKQGKAAGLSEVTTEMIVAGGKIAEEKMLQLCQQVLDGKGIPNEWKTSVVVPIFKGKGDVMNCGSYREVKLLEHGMKIIERVLERRIRTIVDFDEAQFGFMPGKGTIDALFLVRRLQEEYRVKDKRMYICFVDLEKAFDRVPRRVMEWAMRKKGLPEILVKTVMSLYEGAETKVRVGSSLSGEFSVKVGVL